MRAFDPPGEKLALSVLVMVKVDRSGKRDCSRGVTTLHDISDEAKAVGMLEQVIVLLRPVDSEFDELRNRVSELVQAEAELQTVHPGPPHPEEHPHVESRVTFPKPPVPPGDAGPGWYKLPPQTGRVQSVEPDEGLNPGGHKHVESEALPYCEQVWAETYVVMKANRLMAFAVCCIARWTPVVDEQGPFVMYKCSPKPGRVQGRTTIR